MDYLIIAAKDNDEMGCYPIAMTMWSLQIAASDTLATAMNWLCLVLTAFPLIQGSGCFYAGSLIPELHNFWIAYQW